MKMSEQLRETIEEQIATGQLPPGSCLDEASLAQRYGVSRTPAREALIQLQAQGLVEIRPRRGATVSNIEPRRLLEMFEVMAELESMCARLAARRMSAVQREALLQAHQDCQQASTTQDSDAYFYHNERFHGLIYEGCQNVFLKEQAQQLQRRLRPYRRLQLRVRDRMSVSFQEHETIVQAICNGQSEQAANALRAHVLIQGERFSDLLALMTNAKSAAL
jgi:DNA-binding GntR family transcriptional regulator